MGFFCVLASLYLVLLLVPELLNSPLRSRGRKNKRNLISTFRKRFSGNRSMSLEQNNGGGVGGVGGGSVRGHVMTPQQQLRSISNERARSLSELRPGSKYIFVFAHFRCRPLAHDEEVRTIPKQHRKSRKN